MLEQIEKYFDNKLSLDERQVFENQIITDSDFAQEVAFYVQSHAVSKELAVQIRKQKFEEIKRSLSKTVKSKNIKPIVWLSGLAASIILGLGLWNFIGSKTQPTDSVADTYIQQHFENLPVKMDGSPDSLQLGLRLFNDHKLKEAQLIFEEVAKKENNNEAFKYAGIVALKLNDYDKATNYFKILSSQKSLYANPGTFYTAITLLKQSPMNKEKAIKLLEEVIAKNLDGKEDASKILEEIK